MVEYLAKADYYATSPGDLLGKGYDHLDIGNMLPRDVLHCLAHNLDPATGELLRPHAKDGQRVGMDFTFNAPKSVTLLREVGGLGNEGDARVEAAHREAVAYAMEQIEADMKCRVKGGREPDLATGNLCAYRVTHRDTRVNPGDQMPDPHLHDHVFVMNQTFNPVEKRWLAAELGDIKHDCPFYEAVYLSRLASNIRDLGYGIRREGKSFEVAGIDRKLIEKFSRRTQQIEAVASKLGIKNPDSKAKLGATTRLGKTKEPADDLNGYYVSRLTTEEKERLAHLEYAGPGYVSDDRKAVGFAIGHEFYTKSVVEERKLYETALRNGIGSVSLDGVMEEAQRQGVLLKDRQATTRDVLAEESRIIQFASDGKGAMRPLSARLGSQVEAGAPLQLGRDEKRPLIRDASSAGRSLGAFPPDGARTHADPATLSPEQQALVSHIITSRDRVILVIGDAGTGKTRSVREAFDRIQCPVALMAPSATASRDVLRSEGFKNADTVASFLLSKTRQDAVRNGVIWVDEAGLLPITDLSKLADIAKQQNARIVLQGDPKQHRSVARHGNMMNVLEEYAGLKVGRLQEIWRQQHAGYKKVVADIAAGKRQTAFDGLAALGWVQTVENHSAIVEAYFDALATKKPNQDVKDRVVLIAPSHAEGEAITAEIRSRMHDAGMLGEDHEVKRLVNLGWSPAQRGDLESYTGDEVLVFHNNSGRFKKGEAVRLSEIGKRKYRSTGDFGVFREEKLDVAADDRIRITQGGSTKDGHRLDNGMIYTVKGFNMDGDIILNNGWVLGKDFGHIRHGYYTTSIGNQGKTVDRVLVAMGRQSLGALNAREFYVDVSRGRQSAKVFTDLTPDELKKAIQRTDTQLSATELMKPKRKAKVPHIEWWMKRAKDRFRQLRTAVKPVTKEREKEYYIER